MKDKKSGVYETVYGNAVTYLQGDDCGYDLDMAEIIPEEMICFDIYLRDLEDTDTTFDLV
jgi:hypothetical protein